MAEEKRKRILSGIQPTGTPTLGNYIGAVRNWALLQSDYDCLYMVADLHSLTVRQNPAELRRRTRELSALLLADILFGLGLILLHMRSSFHVLESGRQRPQGTGRNFP